MSVVATALVLGALVMLLLRTAQWVWGRRWCAFSSGLSSRSLPPDPPSTRPSMPRGHGCGGG